VIQTLHESSICSGQKGNQWWKNHANWVPWFFLNYWSNSMYQYLISHATFICCLRGSCRQRGASTLLHQLSPSTKTNNQREKKGRVHPPRATMRGEATWAIIGNLKQSKPIAACPPHIEGCCIISFVVGNLEDFLDFPVHPQVCILLSSSQVHIQAGPKTL